MVGRKSDDVVELLPRIFSLCGQAHRAAASLALRGTCGAAQMQRVEAERAREHLLRILMTWRTESDPTLPVEPVMALTDEARLSSAAERLESYLEQHVLGITPAGFLNLTDFDAWIDETRTAPAMWLEAIRQNGWSAVGSVEPFFLPALSREGVLKEIAGGSDFPSAPHVEKKPCETGPLGRYYTHGLVSSVVHQYGAGLMARLAARLVELASLPEAIAGCRSREAVPGFGEIETARGRLIHAATTDCGVVSSYAIIAPTEWNFHPEGLISQGLRGLDLAPAKAFIEAVDPCVDFELRVA